MPQDTEPLVDGTSGSQADDDGSPPNDSVLHRMQYAPPGPTRRIVVDFSALSNYRTKVDAQVVEDRLRADLTALEAALVSRAERRRGIRAGPPIGMSPVGPDIVTPQAYNPLSQHPLARSEEALEPLPAAASESSQQTAGDGGEVQEPSTRPDDADSADDKPADAAPEGNEQPSAAEQLDEETKPEVKLAVEQRPIDSARIPGTDRLFLVPQPPLMDASGEPLLPSERLHRVTAAKAWPAILCVCAALGVILSTIALDITDEGVRSPLYMIGFLLLLVPLGMNTLAYGRAITALIVTGNFEFWYLAAQILVFSTCETLQVLHRGVPMAVAVIPRVFLTWFAIVGLLCIDASRLSRVIKGIIMLVGCILFVALGATWTVNSPIGDDVVSVLLFSTTVGSLATSSYLTLGVFCGKFALQALLFRRSVVLVAFSWTEDETCFQRRRILPPPLPLLPSEEEKEAATIPTAQ